MFDFDGVLVESAPIKTRAFAELYAGYGDKVVEQVLAYHSSNAGISRHVKFRHIEREFLGREIEPGKEQMLASRFAQLVEDAVVAAPWVPGAREFIERQLGAQPMFVASGTPEEELLRIIARRGMSPYFSGVFGAPRSKAAILRHVTRAGNPAATVMVGDAMADYDGAAEAGVRFIGRVAPGASNPFPAGVCIVVDLHELQSLLGEP